MRVFVLLILMFCSCRHTQEQIKIGVLANSGYLAGVSFAADQINHQGGIRKTKIELIGLNGPIRPDTPEEDIQKELQRMIRDPDMIAMIGPSNSTSALVVASACQKAEVPQLVSLASNPAITNISDWTYRICLSDEDQGPLMAQHLLNWGKRRLILLFVMDDYGRGLASSLSDHFEARGGKLLDGMFNNNRIDSDSYAFLDEKIALLAERGFGQSQDAMVLIQRPPAAKIIMELLRKHELNPDLLLADNLSNQDMAVASFDYPGEVRVSLFYDESNATGPNGDYRRSFQEQTGRLPNQENAYTYDAFQLVVQALQSGATNRAEVKAFLDQLIQDQTEIYGVTGTYRLNAMRNAVRPGMFARALDGTWVRIQD